MEQTFHKKKAYALALLTIVVWGTLSPISKILLGELDAMFVLAFSSIVAAVILFFYNLIKGNLKNFKKCSALDIVKMSALGFVGFFLYNWFYLMGIDLLYSQQAMIINYLWPAMIIVFSCIFLKEKVTVSKVSAIALSLIGVAIVAVNGDVSHFLETNLKGVMFCVLAAVSYGFYASLNKKQTYDKELSMMVVFITTAVISSICVIAGGKFPQLSINMTLGLMYNGIVINAIGYTCWMLALEYGNTAVISNMAYLSPFISLVFAKILLDETITVYSVAGLILIILGIFVQAFGEKKHRKNELLEE